MEASDYVRVARDESQAACTAALAATITSLLQWQREHYQRLRA